MKDQHTVAIYALHEPGCDPWYVGCTSADPDERFAQHKRGQGCTTATPHITPDTRINVLARVTGSVDECRKAEHDWIEHGRDVGWPLVNSRSGGAWHPRRNLDHDRAVLSALGSVTIPEFAFFVVCSEQSAKLRLRALMEAGYARRHPDDAARRSDRGKRPLVYEAVKV